MKSKLLRVLKFMLYPLAYLFFLAMFGYFTFPYGRLKDRLIAEFEGKKPGARLEIGTLSSYWFTGVELADVKIILPPSSESPATTPFGTPSDAPPPKETVVAIDYAHARLRFLPLLIGRLRVDFGAQVFGGEVSGSVPVSSAGDVDLEWEKLDASKIEPLAAVVGGVPVKGTASGKLELSPVDGKFSKANGAFALDVSGLSIGDGKSKLMGLVELPTAKAGELAIEGEAKDGVLTFKKLGTTGPDIDLVGDGHISLKEPWDASNADVYLRFKFADAYRTKSDLTKGLLGDPNASFPPPMIEQDPRMKRSKRSDGYYGWHVHGELKRLRYDPASSDALAGRKGGSKGDAPFPPAKKASGVQTPLGMSTASPPPLNFGGGFKPPTAPLVTTQMPSAPPPSPPEVPHTAQPTAEVTPPPPPPPPPQPQPPPQDDQQQPQVEQPQQQEGEQQPPP